MPTLQQQLLACFVGDRVLSRDQLRLDASYDVVGRVLRKLTERGRLVQIGYGLYVRAERSPLTGKPAPVVGIGRLASEALSRLGKPVEEASFTRDYGSGRSTRCRPAAQSPSRAESGAASAMTANMSLSSAPDEALLGRVAGALAVDEAFVEKDWYVLHAIGHLASCDGRSPAGLIPRNVASHCGPKPLPPVA